MKTMATIFAYSGLAAALLLGFVVTTRAAVLDGAPHQSAPYATVSGSLR